MSPIIGGGQIGIMVPKCMVVTPMYSTYFQLHTLIGYKAC